MASGSFKCAAAVQVTIHPAHNPSMALPVRGSNQTPVSLNVSLSHPRAPLPLGPFLPPIFLDYVVASGGRSYIPHCHAYNNHTYPTAMHTTIIHPPLPCIQQSYIPHCHAYNSHTSPTAMHALMRATCESLTWCAVAVLQVRLHSCSPPFPPGSSMQSCTLTFPALPILDAVLISPIGAYTTHFTVYSAAAASLLPAFASNGDMAATVRVGHGTCDVVSASSPIPHAHLNDLGSAAGFLQVLRLKTCAPSSLMWSAQGAFAWQAVSDVVLSAAGSVVTTSTAAIAHLLQV